MPSQLVPNPPHRDSATLNYAGVDLTVYGLVTYPENRIEFAADRIETAEGIDNILPLIGEDVIAELNTMAAVQVLYERGEAEEAERDRIRAELEDDYRHNGWNGHFPEAPL